MTRRQTRRNPWSTLFAALLSALAGVSAFGVNASHAGGLSAAEHAADLRATGKTASIRPDAFDPSLRLGGSNGSDVALHPRDIAAESWANGLQSVLPAAFRLPVSIARTRDGRTRAPPRT